MPVITAAVWYTACVETYEPALREGSTGSLVVEAQLMNDSSVVKLSRSGAVNAAKSEPERNARLWVESEDASYQSPLFREFSAGKYTADLKLTAGTNYRLRIETEDGKTYRSDYVPYKISPPVEDIGFEVSAGKVHYHVSTSDPTNSTRYYRWEYEETWMYRSAFESYWRFRNGEMYFLPLNQQTYTCWKSDTSTGIFIATTEDLADDVVSRKQLHSIDPQSSYKLNLRYSLLVKQYALTKEGFEFWSRLKDNTEKLGSIFDPLPAQIPGNLECTSNPAEAVIGFVNASSMSTKRIFNLHSDFPFTYFFDPVYDCVQEIQPLTRGPIDLRDAFEDSTTYLPIDTVPGNSQYWYASSPFCIDCRIRGGSIKKPDFW